MIGISADFDPVHNGHVKLIEKGREIAEKTGDEVAIYMNKGYSANHAPFFVNFEARKEMALKAGADKVIPIEGLHNRLTLAYSVPIRIAMMIEDGVVDYVDAANVSTDEIIKHSQKFINKGIFVGIPRNLPNRNVIRWFAVNEFLYKKYNKKMRFHIIPELEYEGKISGREIRRAILENDMEIPDMAYELLPKTTIKILKREIKEGRVPNKRDIKGISKKLNNYSRAKLQNIAYLNADAVDRLIESKHYYEEEQIWASLRRAGYGPVLTRLAISTIEGDITRREVLDLMRSYEKKGVIPKEQSIDRVIERAWYVSKSIANGKTAREANKEFKNVKVENVQKNFNAGLSLNKFEAKKLEEGRKAEIFVNKKGFLSCEIKGEGWKIKSPLKLKAQNATFIRMIIDSHFIPISAKVIKTDSGLRIKISIIDHSNTSISPHNNQ